MTYKDKTIQAYDAHVKSFSEKFSAQMDFERPEFNTFMGLLSGNKVLDVGCGSGDHMSYFQKKGLDVMGIDLSKEFVNICVQKGLNVIQMDMEQMNFEKESFDGIWAVTSLLHVPKINLGNILKKFNNILTSNGVIYICLIEGDGEGFLKDERFF